MALPHGAIGWFAACDCGISWYNSLALFVSELYNFMLTDNRRTEILDIGQNMFSFGSYDLNINVHARIQKFPGPQEWVLTFFVYQRNSQRAVRIAFVKQLNPMCPIGSLDGRPYQYF